MKNNVEMFFCVAQYIVVVVEKMYCVVAEAFIIFLYNDKKRMTVVCINESEVVTFILTHMN